MNVINRMRNQSIFSYRQPLTIEEQTKALKRVASLRLSMEVFQMCANGIIESNAYNIMEYVESHNLQDKAKKGKNPYKWFYNTLKDAYKKVRAMTRRIETDMFNACVKPFFPFYGDDYIKSYGIAPSLHSQFLSSQQENIDRLYDEGRKMFLLFDGKENAELYAHTLVLQATCHALCLYMMDYECMVRNISKDKGICVKKLDVSLYEHLKKVGLQFVKQAGGWQDGRDVDVTKALSASESYQHELFGYLATHALENPINSIYIDFINYCMARLTMDYGRNGVPEGAWDFCAKIYDGKRSVSVLKREMTMLNKKCSGDVEDFIDLIYASKTPCIDMLRDLIMRT